MTNAKQALQNLKNKNELDRTEQARALISTNKDVTLNGGVFSGSDQFALAQRMAKALISSNMVPSNFRDVGSCLIAIDMAARLKMNVLAVMQNMYIVHGKPAWSSQFIISSINQSGLFASSLHFEFVGKEGTDSYGCKAWALDKKTKDKIEGTTITIQMAKDEGWYGKSGSKWKTMPEQMLRYRAAAFFGRTYAPDVTMGIYTKDEIEDRSDADDYQVVAIDDAYEDVEVEPEYLEPDITQDDTKESPKNEKQAKESTSASGPANVDKTADEIIEDDFFGDDFKPVTDNE